MQHVINEFELKAQARRLKKAMEELQMPVQTSVVLNLVARAHGVQNWETIRARLLADAGASDRGSLLPDASSTQQLEAYAQWVEWLEAALRIKRVTEEDLDDLVYDLVSETQASVINNEGMGSQLDALHKAFSERPSEAPKARQNLVAAIEKAVKWLVLPVPESVSGQAMFGIPMRVSICAGSSHEESMRFDALEWFANHDTRAIDSLISDGLENSASSDEVALWLEESSCDEGAKSRMTELLVRMRSIHQSHPTFVGVTVSIHEMAVREFIAVHVKAGVTFSEETMAFCEE